MTFEEAESKFKDLQGRVQRGEPISRAEYEAQVSQLGVYDEKGVLWEINPRTGKWMYFDGAEWVPGRPPGRDQSTVMPLAQLTTPASTVTARQSFAPPAAAPGAGMPASTASTRETALARPAPASASPARTSASVGRVTAPPESVEGIERFPEVPSNPSVELRARTFSGNGGAKPTGGSAPNPFANKPWLPFAIGAVVLLICAIVLFVGGGALVNSLQSQLITRTPTRSAIAPATLPPTPTRFPTNTPIPPTPVPVVGKVTTTTSNVRAAPDTRARILTTLKKNNQVTLIAQTNGQKIAGKDVWYQINIAGQPAPGWIFGDNIEITDGDPKILPAVAGTPTPTPRGATPRAGGATPTLTPIGGSTPTPRP